MDEKAKKAGAALFLAEGYKGGQTAESLRREGKRQAVKDILAMYDGSPLQVNLRAQLRKSIDFNAPLNLDDITAVDPDSKG